MADDDVMDTPGDDLRDVLGMPPRRAPAVLAAGQIIDDAYRIEEEIGAGGMGRVYRAHDLRLSRDVALKLHGFALAPDDDTLRREATALARLTHPNVVHVYEVGTWNGHPWVAMEYVPGGTVRTWLRAEHRTAQQILALFVAAGRGLAAAHAAGLVHRDFKPDNVLVGDDGRVCVADFGLARDASVVEAHVGDIVASPSPSLSTRTKTGTVRGTPAYMAPEQRDGTRVDASADQFAFAVSLWEALTGARPFSDDGTTVIAPPAGRMPRHVEVALRRAMARAPAERWPSMAELLDELARDPARTRFMIAISLIAMVALVGGGYAIASRRQASAPAVACGSIDEIADTWGGPQHAAIRAAHPGEPGERVIEFVDAWSDRWRQEREAVCRSTQPAQLVALRDACLDRARASLSATVDVLAGSKLSPAQAVMSTSSLARLEDCADIATLAGAAPPPTEPSDIASEQATLALTARVQALITAGQYPQAVAVARDAVAYTEKLARPALSARAQMALGGALYMTGAKDGVLERYEGAARLAAEAQDDVQVAMAYLMALTFVLRNEKPGEVDRITSVAETAITRAGKPAALVERLVAGRAEITMKRAKYAEAAALYRQTIAAAEARYGADSEDVARYLTSLAGALNELLQPAEARAALDRAAKIMEQRYGSLHPNLGVILTTLGNVDLAMGDYSAALATYRRAIAMKEATMGPNHRSLSPTLTNLASALDLSGEHAEAVATGKRALAITEAAYPPSHPKIPFVLHILAKAQMNAGDWAGAKASIERAVAILEPLGDEGAQSDVLAMLARLRTHEGKLPAARAAAERAIAVATALVGDSTDLVRALHELARVQRADADSTADTTYQRAIELARKIAGPRHPMVLALEAEAAGRGK
ncbi:MAG: tetratricopeptide repeat protein [Kofleriaceae bacterium]